MLTGGEQQPQPKLAADGTIVHRIVQWGCEQTNQGGWQFTALKDAWTVGLLFLHMEYMT